MKKADSYHLKLTGNGVEIERDVPEPTAKRIIVMVMTGGLLNEAITANPVRPSGGGILEEGERTPGADGDRPKLSLVEYIKEHGPKRNPDIIATIASYQKKYFNKRWFSSADMTAAFADASEPGPKNMSRDMKWTAKLGWIAPQPGKKNMYYITTSGEDAVRQKFPADLIRKTAQPRGRKKSERPTV